MTTQQLAAPPQATADERPTGPRIDPSVTISTAQPENYEAIVDLFRRYDYALRERAWWDWKYLRNPRGRALPFKIERDGQLVGAVAMMPQAFHWRERELVGIQTVDGLLGDEIRGQGIFNEVMAFLLDHRPPGVDRNYFYLSFPRTAASVRAHENAGWQLLAAGRVYTFILKAEGLRREGLGRLVPLARPCWPLVRHRILSQADPRLTVRPIERFTPELVPTLPDHLVRGDRSVPMLNWRVIDNPRDTLQAWSLHRDGKLEGCFIGRPGPDRLEIVEALFAKPRPHHLASFLAWVHREDLAPSVDLLLFGRTLNRELLPECGFKRHRYEGYMYVHSLDRACLPEIGAMWQVSYLDTDW